MGLVEAKTLRTPCGPDRLRERWCRMRHKKLKIGLATMALVAVCAVGYAYWTGEGSGSGEGTVGTSSTVTLTGTVAPGAAPGTDSAVAFTAANADTSPIYVTTVHLDSIVADGAHATCNVADFTMADVTENHE